MNTVREFADSTISPHFKDSTIARDFFGMICGDAIALGSSREVYQFNQDDTKVIKFEHRDASFQNVSEWTVWNDLCYTEIGKQWLAPCHWISGSGKILIQSKAETLLKRRDMIPDKVPAWFTDHKLENFGVIDDRVVCIDYGLHCLNNFGSTKRMVKFLHEEIR